MAIDLPPRSPEPSPWHLSEIHRLQCALDVANTHHVVLVQEITELRRALFAERAANRVIDGPRLTLDDLADTFQEVLGAAKVRLASA